MSLAELSAAAGIGIQTLRRDVQELIDAGWVADIGQEASTGGRPARRYGLDGDSHILVGIHLELPGVRIALVALDGRLVDSHEMELDDSMGPGAAIREVVTQVRRLADRYPDRAMVGIGVATPGFINPETGGLLSVGRQPGWDNFPVHTQLARQFGVDVLVVNDVDCMAFEESISADWDSPNTLYIGFSEGVKLSMWLDGRLYRGHLGNAGIIGSTLVTGRDGARVPLEQVSSVNAVCRRFEREADPADEVSAAILAESDHAARFSAILAAAAEDHSPAAEIVDAALDALGEAVATVVTVLHPDLMILGGALSDLDEARWAGFQDRIRAAVPALVGHRLILRQGRGSSALSAALGVAHQVLRSAEVDLPDTAKGLAHVQ